MSSLLIPKVSSYTFSSDPAVGAINVRNNGSSFSVNLNRAIAIPRGSVDCTVDVIQANIWYVMPNISAALGNNNFYFSSAVTLPGAYHIVVPDGLYSMNDLNNTLQRDFANLGFASNIMVFTGDDPTQRSVITYTIAGLQVDFTQANTIRTILGFDSRLSPAIASTAGESDTSDTTATFNGINSFYVRSSLISSDGLPINNTGTGIIAAVPISAEPGTQIVYQPQVPIDVDARNLIGSSVQYITFDLLDDQLRPVNTLGESWSITMHIHYSILMTTERVPLLNI